MTTRAVTGYALILLAALIIAGLPLSAGLLDHNPRDRDEIADYLAYINNHETQYGIRMALVFFKDAVVSVVIGAGLYLSFTSVNRSLALIGAAGWLVSAACFNLIDGMEAAMIALADAHSAGDDVLVLARTLAVVSSLGAQAAFSSFALAVAALGIMFLRAPAGVVPGRWLGWVSLVVAASWWLLWISVLTEAGFVFIPIGAISGIVWMLGVGIYLVRHPEPVAKAEPAIT
jgi:hypothetical protein